MLDVLATLFVLGVMAVALLLTRDVCRRYPVTGALCLAAGAALVAFVAWAAVPRNDDAIPWGPGTGEAIAFIFVSLVHFGVAGVLVVVALAQAVVRANRADRCAIEQEDIVLGEPHVDKDLRG